MKNIETTYCGVTFRSRMEAQCACFFNKLGWIWVYEPYSLMLPSGLTYIPDFHIRGYFAGRDYGPELIVECRGYHSKRGDAQLAEFASLTNLPAGERFRLDNEFELSRFVIIGPDSVLTFPGIPTPIFLQM